MYLLNVVHHDSFHLSHLGFDLGDLVHLLRVLHTVLHVIFQLWSESNSKQVEINPKTASEHDKETQT
jgi:succinyl-CoA synthetase beta subunit